MSVEEIQEADAAATDKMKLKEVKATLRDLVDQVVARERARVKQEEAFKRRLEKEKAKEVAKEKRKAEKAAEKARAAVERARLAEEARIKAEEDRKRAEQEEVRKIAEPFARVCVWRCEGACGGVILLQLFSAEQF